MNSTQSSGIGMTSRRTRERLIQRLQEQGITNTRVLELIRNTPRHIFLDEALSHRAYEDTALPIGFSQTLSQPYIVARMSQLLLSKGMPQKVLEIGTGSGYQTAILAQLVPEVYSVERIAPLLEKAKERVAEFGFRNVELKYDDGSMGWPEKAPFNAILSAAAPYTVPHELLGQLAPNGILIIPIGKEGQQELRFIQREGSSDRFTNQVIEPVRFVPLLSGTA